MANQAIAVETLWGGISKQAASNRHANQVSDATDKLFSILDGATTRPSMAFVKKITSLLASGNYRFHTIKRDETEQYLVLYGQGASGNTLRIFKLDGTEATVNFDPGGGTDAADYYDLNSPTADQIVMTSSDDYTIIANRTVACATKTAGADIDETLAPIQLTRKTVTPLVFEVATIPWTTRASGDSTTNPAPSIFTDGHKITDLVFFRQRLVMTGDENVVMSRADGTFFNLYIKDIANIVDSDPIDYAIGSDAVAIIQRVAVFRKTLIIFTKSGQEFELDTDGNILSASTVSFTPSTAFGSTDRKPTKMGTNLYFISQEDNASTIYEYLYSEAGATNDAWPITSHVEGLLPANIKTLVSSPNNNTLLALPTDGSTIYVYRAHWQGDQKVQSAWSKYTTDAADRIVDIAVIDNAAYLLMELSSGDYIIEKLPLSSQLPDSGMSNTIHLDRMQQITGVYSAGPNTTEWDYGFDDTSVNSTVLGNAFGSKTGSQIIPTRKDDHTLQISGDFSAGTAYVGRLFSDSLTPSRPYAKDRQGNAIIDGRLQLRKLITNHRNTAFYQVEVEHPPRTTRINKLRNYKVGVATIGQMPIDAEGALSTLIQGSSEAITVNIVNPSPFSSKITSLEWIAELTRRSF